MLPAPSEVPATVLDRLRALEAGARLLDAAAGLDGLHLVGGAVRDLLLGVVPRELDVVAEGDGPAAAAALARALGGRVRVHEAFGTASVEGAGPRIDVATARAERYPRPGALPVVRPGTMDEDMARRDFTVNAIAVGISADRRGTLHAFPGALEDLAARRLRVLHERSFVDDPTRLVRLVRYASRGLSIDPATEALARAAIASGAPATAGVARMGDELLLLLGEEAAVDGLARLDALASGALGDVMLLDGVRLERGLLDGVLGLLPPDGSRELALLSALARDSDRGRLGAWLRDAHVRGAARVLEAVADPAGLAAAMRDAPKPSALERLLRGRAVEAVVLAGACGAPAQARRYLTELRAVRLEITGADLLAAGVPQGPEIGRRLDRALARKLDDGLAGRDAELAAALE
jgi:tRNA nucleotidyltransferase (CCA-adding enzyme)